MGQIRLYRSPRTEQRGQRPEHDNKKMTIRTGHPGQDGWDRTDRQDSRNVTIWTGQRGQENWGQEPRDRTAGTEHPGQDSWKEQLGKDNCARKETTGWQNMT